MTRTPPYRVGVIGIGFGQRVHVPAFRMDSRFEVSAVCASSEERARMVAARLGIPRAHGDWRELVADGQIDVVSIATPPQLQPEIAERAVDGGKHVFLEKPLGGGGARASELARRVEHARLAAVTDFELETVDVWRRARGLLHDRRLGRLRHVAVSWNVETYAHQQRLTSSWKLNPDQGGGTLNSFGSHTLRYLEWLFGPTLKLCARLHPRAADETDHLWLTMQGGLPVSVVLGSNSHNANSHRLEIYGEKGFLVLENRTSDYVSGFTLTIHSDPMTSPEMIRSELSPGAAGDGRVLATGLLVERLGDAIESGDVPEPGVREGARVERLLDCARFSDLEERWIETDPAGE